MYKVGSVLECQTADEKRVDIDIYRADNMMGDSVATISIKVKKENQFIIQGLETLIRKHVTKVNQILKD
jgi:hypothetical protein